MHSLALVVFVSAHMGWEWLAKHLLQRILVENNLAEPKRSTAALGEEALTRHGTARRERDEGRVLCCLRVWH